MTWGAVAAGVGSMAVGYLASKGQSEAAEAGSDAERYAADLQMQQFEQSRQDQLPYMGIGGNALAQMSSLYGLYNPAYFSPGANLPWSPSPGDQAGGQGAQGAQGLGSAVNPLGGLIGGSGNKGAYISDYDRYLATLMKGQDAGVGNAGGFQQWQAAQGLQQSQGQPNGSDANVDMRFNPTGYEGFTNAPEYKHMQDALRFGLAEGTKGLDRAAAAGGGLLSGGQAKALSRYANDYSNAQMSGAYGDYYNRLAALANTGQTATQQTGVLGANAAANAGMGYANAGAYNAAGIQGSSGAWQNALNQGLYGVGQAGGFGSLFGGRQPQAQAPAYNPNIAGPAGFESNLLY